MKFGVYSNAKSQPGALRAVHGTKSRIQISTAITVKVLLTLKLPGYFDSCHSRGGGPLWPPLKISAADRAITTKICMMVENDVIYAIALVNITKFIYFILYELIMLIYSWNHTFCSDSLNKAPRMLFFGENILYSIPNNCEWKKFWYQDRFLMYFIVFLISYVFLCFFTFCFLLFFRWKLFQT